MQQEEVKEHFAKQADTYEELMARLIPQYRAQHGIFYDLLPQDEREYRVLDLGCGNGVLSELVLRKIPRSFVVCFDLTEKMLQACEKKLSAYAGRFELRQGDYRTDPIGEGYDIIMAGLTLHHLPKAERRRFYPTIYSGLHSGGLLLTRDIIIDEDQSVAQQQYALWKEFMKTQGEDPGFWYAKHIAKDHPVTLANHCAWLKDAGFSRVACHWRLYNFVITAAEKV